MGHISVVYGYIYGIGGNAEENAARIAALPEHDKRPYLTRDMFSVPNMEHSYWDQLISFGLVYNRVELWWEQWLEKFEALLRTMYWDEAHVYLKTELWGSYHYVWEPLEGAAGDSSTPPWTFSGGPRTGLGQVYVKSQSGEKWTEPPQRSVGETERHPMTEVVNLAREFALFQDYWSPKIAGELNDSYIKLAKLKGEFVWHQHEHEDELFLVVKGRLLIKLRDRDLWLDEGEFVVIPRGVEHLPIAAEEVHVLLLEPRSTLNTGEVRNERTVDDLERI